MKHENALAHQFPITADDENSSTGIDAGEIPLPRILLLDDDVLFCRLMTKIGAKRNIQVISCQNVQTFRELARWAPHDVVILDYYLEDDHTGPEIARDLPREQVIVISNNEAELRQDEEWPRSVKISISKAMGVNAILEAACAVQNFT